MSLPQTAEARTFYRSAWERLEDAQFLMQGKRTTGATYLAGYAVECMLKALILLLLPPRGRSETLAAFRGAKGHDYEWLTELYRAKGGPALPFKVAQRFALVSDWSVDMRYRPGAVKEIDAQTFLRATKEIMTWGDGRL